MTDVDICNLALSYLGDSATVTSINPPEGSAQAQLCARFYPIAVKIMLEGHDWNFITTRVALALLSITPLNDWQYAYAMPPSVNTLISVKPQCLYAGLGCERAYWMGYLGCFEFETQCLDDFQIEAVGDGTQMILSNATDAIARYTLTEATSGQFSASFTDALAWKLASMLAGPLLKGDEGAAESKRCLGMYASLIGPARVQDAQQKHGNQQHYPSWIVGR
jgi:hypothetical protein